MRYGKDYLTPCRKFAVDIMNDQATKSSAERFFFEVDQIMIEMQQALAETFAQHCYSNIEFFQLSGVDLPNRFEDAIDETQIAKQDITTAQEERKSMQTRLNTRVKEATI